MNATISVDYDSRLLDLFAPEDKILSRGSYSLEHVKDKIDINIQAQDPVALRTILNAVCKTFIIWNKGELL